MGDIDAMFIKLLVIYGLIQLMQDCKPFWSAFIYSFLYFTLGFLLGVPLDILMVYCPIKFILALIYFWMLQQSVDGFVWWLIAIVGYFLLV